MVDVADEHVPIIAGPRYTAVVKLLFLLPAIMWAQTTPGSVRGTVVDPADGAIGGATVHLLSVEHPEDVPDARSDKTGRFSFDRVAPGWYVLSVGTPGFRARFKAIL